MLIYIRTKWKFLCICILTKRGVRGVKRFKLNEKKWKFFESNQLTQFYNPDFITNFSRCCEVWVQILKDFLITWTTYITLSITVNFYKISFRISFTCFSCLQGQFTRHVYEQSHNIIRTTSCNKYCLIWIRTVRKICKQLIYKVQHFVAKKMRMKMRLRCTILRDELVSIQ